MKKIVIKRGKADLTLLKMILMFRVIINKLFDDGSGRLGNATVYKARIGTQVRYCKKGANPQTSYQVNIRVLFKTYAQAWKQLSQAEILSWNTAAAAMETKNILGIAYTRTGENLFIQTNVNLAIYGGAPQMSTCPTFGTATISANIANPDVTGGNSPVLKVDIPAIAANDVLYLMASSPFSPGISNYKNKAKPIKTYATGPAILQDNFTSDYVARFGNPASGEKIVISAKVMNIINPSIPTVTGSELTPLLK
jgi:hypothetical protein